jgi:plastocyanin
MFRRAAVGAIALLLASTGSASAGTDAEIDMFDFGFSPTSASQPIGYSVHWHNDGSLTHTATANKFNLFDKTVPPGQSSASVVLTRAGTWSYHCEIHPEMQGRVRAHMLAEPFSGNTSTTFKLRVATAPLPAGFVEDIQRRKQGSGSWKLWRTTSHRSVDWAPSNPGAWQFRARLRKMSNGQATGWSSVIAVSVTE